MGDPYCQITINGHTVTSKTVEDTSKPKWEQRIYFPTSGMTFVTEGKEGMIKCWDEDPGKADDYYGKGYFFLENFQTTAQKRKSARGYEYVVELRGGESGGKLDGRNPKVKFHVYMIHQTRLSTFSKLPMDKSWMTTGKTNFPKSKEAGEDCIVRVYDGEDDNGKELQVTNVQRCKEGSVIYNKDVANKIGSVRISKDCEHVVLMDEDSCSSTSSDNVKITKNAQYGRRRRRWSNTGANAQGKTGYQEIPWDLLNDICGIKVKAKCRL